MSAGVTAARDAVALLVDGNMVAPAAFLASELCRLNRRPDVDIHVFCDTEAAAAEFARARVPCQVGVLRPDLPGFTALPRNAQIPSGVSYARLLLPAALGPRYRRTLYLDADLKIEDPAVFDIFDLDMAGHALAAVRDPVMSFSRSPRVVAYRDGLGVGDRYFNDGVLLLDNPRFEAELEGVLGVIAADPGRLVHLQQTALNVAFRHRWLELSPCWNLFAEYAPTAVGRAFPPRVVHFVGSAKPWRELKFFADVDFQARLRSYLAASPWPGYIASNRTARDARKFFFVRPLLRFRMDAARRAMAPLFRRYANGRKIDRAAFLAYLRGTAFADVEQGIVRPDPGLLPG